MSANSFREQFKQREEPEIQVQDDEAREEDEDVSPDPRIYQAFAKGTQGGRRGDIGILLYYADGITVEILYYTYLMRVLCTGETIVTLMCTDAVYTLTGQHLMELLPLLREHKIRFLQAFMPEKHAALPANSDQPVIEAIIMQHIDEWWDEYLRRSAIRPTEDA
jgi:hypothetical protein